VDLSVFFPVVVNVVEGEEVDRPPHAAAGAPRLATAAVVGKDFQLEPAAEAQVTLAQERHDAVAAPGREAPAEGLQFQEEVGSVRFFLPALRTDLRVGPRATLLGETAATVRVAGLQGFAGDDRQRSRQTAT